MSFGKVMAHIALANNRAFATVSGLKAPETPEKIAAAYKDPKGGVFDKEATVQFLRDSFDFCTKALAEITPEKLDAMTGPMSGRERLWAYFTHTAHHRGQAEVYLRMKNIKPPDYRVLSGHRRISQCTPMVHAPCRRVAPSPSPNIGAVCRCWRAQFALEFGLLAQPQQHFAIYPDRQLAVSPCRPLAGS